MAEGQCWVSLKLWIPSSDKRSVVGRCHTRGKVTQVHRVGSHMLELFLVPSPREDSNLLHVLYILSFLLRTFHSNFYCNHTNDHKLFPFIRSAVCFHIPWIWAWPQDCPMDSSKWDMSRGLKSRCALGLLISCFSWNSEHGNEPKLACWRTRKYGGELRCPRQQQTAEMNKLHLRLAEPAQTGESPRRIQPKWPSSRIVG